ncbi:MAG: redoxin domain-containing protein [Oscillatoria sp. SIO1A7]|nr:redoxin domain-containing protein [Oscillatoria sp. SIO1A7]
MKQSTETLSLGDPAPLFVLPDSEENKTFLATQAGKPILLFFYANDDLPQCRQISETFRDFMPKFEALNLEIISVSLNSPSSRQKFAQDYQITFTLLSDANHEVSGQYGLYKRGNIPDNPDLVTYSRTAFLLDINLRVVKIYSLINAIDTISEILVDVQNNLSHESPRHLTMQAPVLLIPNVLTPEFCRYLIQRWETEGNAESGYMRQQGEKTTGVIDHTRKIRRDHFVENSDLIHYLDLIMNRRVFPEIRKVFQFPVTRREGYKIGCYDGSRRGFFRRHRDNTTLGTAHRRFAMTLNLNVGEYEGGYLTFPEYGPHLYKPDTGSAVIFSCSLMHEATPVTSGRRFGLFAFFYGNKEAEEREAYESRVKNDYNLDIRSSCER